MNERDVTLNMTMIVVAGCELFEMLPKNEKTQLAHCHFYKAVEAISSFMLERYDKIQQSIIESVKQGDFSIYSKALEEDK